MKKRPAFTLMEAMIALAIGAMALFWASTTQVGSLNRLFLRAGELSRMYEVKTALYRFYTKPQKSLTKIRKENFETPLVSTSTFYEEIPKKSSLYFWSNRIRRVRSEGIWENKAITKTPIINSLITFVTIPPSKEKSS